VKHIRQTAIAKRSAQDARKLAIIKLLHSAIWALHGYMHFVDSSNGSRQPISAHSDAYRGDYFGVRRARCQSRHVPADVDHGATRKIAPTTSIFFCLCGLHATTNQSSEPRLCADLPSQFFAGLLCS